MTSIYRILILVLAISAIGFAASRGTAAPEEKKSEWDIDQPVEQIPAEPMSGRVFGHDVQGYRVSVSKSITTIESKNKIGGWSAWRITIFAGKEDLDEPIVVTPTSEESVPHVHLNVGVEGRELPGTLMYTGMYAMRFEQVDDQTFKLHLSLPDYKQTYLIGQFSDNK